MNHNDSKPYEELEPQDTEMVNSPIKDPNIEEEIVDENRIQQENVDNKSYTPLSASSIEMQTIQANYRFAGFWMRFWAYLLDLVVIGSIDRLIINPIFRVLDIDLNEMSMFAPISIATAIIFYVYFVLMTKFLGQTLGKMVFGLKVVNLQGERLNWATVLFREWIGRFISATILIGYIIVAFLPKKQGLHDVFADTSVIHEK